MFGTLCTVLCTAHDSSNAQRVLVVDAFEQMKNVVQQVPFLHLVQGYIAVAGYSDSEGQSNSLQYSVELVDLVIVSDGSQHGASWLLGYTSIHASSPFIYMYVRSITSKRKRSHLYDLSCTCTLAVQCTRFSLSLFFYLSLFHCTSYWKFL